MVLKKRVFGNLLRVCFPLEGFVCQEVLGRCDTQNDECLLQSCQY